MAGTGEARIGRPEPWNAVPPISEQQLAGDRATFWETQPQLGGNPQVWETLRIAAEALLNGDLELCSTVIDAGDIRAVDGSLELCYDSTGVMYQLPRFIFSTPRNLVSAADAVLPKRSGHRGPVVSIPVTIRLSASPKTTEEDVDLVVRSDQTIADVKRQLHAALVSGAHDDPAGKTGGDTSSSRRRGEGNTWRDIGLPVQFQQVYARGRHLPDECLVQECGVTDNSFLQVFIKPGYRKS